MLMYTVDHGQCPAYSSEQVSIVSAQMSHTVPDCILPTVQTIATPHL